MLAQYVHSTHLIQDLVHLIQDLVHSWFIFHPVTSGCFEKIFLCVKNYQDFIKLRQKNFLTCLDKILPISYQGVPRNVVYQDLRKMCQVLHELARSCMTWQGVSSFVSLGLLEELRLLRFKFFFENVIQTVNH